MVPIDYSVRRRYLDRDLEMTSAELSGQVLEIGSGRIGQRGRFKRPHQTVDRWIYLDRDDKRRPHVRADLGRLPFPAQQFDSVVCLEVLEYVWTAEEALAEISRVLKPNGTLILSTPFLHRVDAPDDYWRFTEPALRSMLDKTGFDVLRWFAQGAALASAVNTLRYVISLQSFWTRRFMSILLSPVFELMLAIDSSQASRHPDLARFTTGYVIMARRIANRPA